MKPVVIVNPAARSERARRFAARLDVLAGAAAVRLTRAAGDARLLAAEAVREGCDTVVAAGGDGTVNEVLNGLADADEGLARARLAIVPLGTVNVLARELGIPRRADDALALIHRGREARIDLPWAAWNGQRRAFALLAGAGLDARAIELVDYRLKRRFGPLAYVLAGARALRGPLPAVRAGGGASAPSGPFVVVGNGVRYGGELRFFPGARLDDGLLDVCVVPRLGLGVLARALPALLAARRLPASIVERFRAPRVALAADGPVPFELDGEWAGNTPVTLSVERRALRVVVP